MSHKPDERDSYSPTEFAKRNGIGRATVYRKMADGTLPFFLLGSRMRRIPALLPMLQAATRGNMVRQPETPKRQYHRNRRVSETS